jgi:hypothetical protein
MVLPIFRSVRLPCCLLAVCIASSGCQMFEALSPAQLWKLNRQPNMDSGNAYFSIPTDESEVEEGDRVSNLEAPERSR